MKFIYKLIKTFISFHRNTRRLNYSAV